MIIRNADLDDAEGIATVHVASWQKIYRDIIPNSILDNLSVNERTRVWRERIKQNLIILVIEENKSIVGFASVCAARDSDLDIKLYGELSTIYLNPKFWGKGLGAKLCEQALEYLRDNGFLKVIVWVLQKNNQAKKFYEALGFIYTGYTKDEIFEKNVSLQEVRYVKSFTQQFTFKRLQENDLDLLCEWLDNPQVKEWWDDNLTKEEIKQKYGSRINDEIVVHFIIYFGGKPLEFIQYYHADKVGDGWWPDATEGTIAIDQFIAKSDFIGRGFGTLMIKEFIDHLFSNPNIKKIITDVDKENTRAIRCYEKVGFHFVKELMTPDGLANLMQIEREII